MFLVELRIRHCPDSPRLGLAAEQKYSKSYSAIANAICLFLAPEQVQDSLAQSFLLERMD